MMNLKEAFDLVTEKYEILEQEYQQQIFKEATPKAHYEEEIVDDVHDCKSQNNTYVLITVNSEFQIGQGNKEIKYSKN